MKTKIISTGLAFAGVLTTMFLSSYRSSPGVPPTLTNKAGGYNEVRTFVWNKICVPMRANLNGQGKNASTKYFSRCPSGYMPDITTGTDSVTTDNFVVGEIAFYKGCEPKYICDFKVCVNTGYAVVRSKGRNNYMDVSEWITMKNNANNKQNKSIVKG